MTSLRTVLLLLALLPGLVLAGLGDLRVCIEALAPGADCCAPVADSAPGGCCSGAESGGDPRAQSPRGEGCAQCCIEVGQAWASTSRPSAPSAVAELAAAAFPAPAFPHPSAEALRRASSPGLRPPRAPGERGFVPLRI